MSWTARRTHHQYEALPRERWLGRRARGAPAAWTSSSSVQPPVARRDGTHGVVIRPDCADRERTAPTAVADRARRVWSPWASWACGTRRTVQRRLLRAVGTGGGGDRNIPGRRRLPVMPARLGRLAERRGRTATPPPTAGIDPPSGIAASGRRPSRSFTSSGVRSPWSNAVAMTTPAAARIRPMMTNMANVMAMPRSLGWRKVGTSGWSTTLRRWPTSLLAVSDTRRGRRLW